MKRYKITKKHPELASNIILKKRVEVDYYTYDFTSCDKSMIEVSVDEIEDWLEKGWIKEVKQKVWCINIADNWKLKKMKKIVLAVIVSSGQKKQHKTSLIHLKNK